MQGLYPSRRTPGQFSPATLYAEIGHWVTAVVKNVTAIVLRVGEHDFTSAKNLFVEHSKGLTELAELLIDYTEWQVDPSSKTPPHEDKPNHPYYIITHQNAETLAAAQATITKARQCAKLFDDYLDEPQTYNQGNVAVELHGLLTQLTDLWGWLGRAAEKNEVLAHPHLPITTKAHTFLTSDMPPYELALLIYSKYSEDDIYYLATRLGISGDDLDDTTPRSLARTLVEQAQAPNQYPALVAIVGQDHPEL